MITRIGIVAGEIWQLLEGNEVISVGDIVTRLDRPEFVILMSLGWLSREGHILLDGEDTIDVGEYKVSLRPKRETQKAEN
ncbi:MAG: winged helix-turn-helix domain-containing protein [Candidatus Hodarchaeales archaeon]|jgi:hypothetical protein